MDNNMNGNARFLIAKYIPDMRQMEPRNMGVIVWAQGLVAHKFAGKGEPYPEQLAIHSTTDFKHWIDYWVFQANRAELSVNGGDPISRESADFVDALLSKARERYMLVDGGLLLDPVDENNIEDIADDLFHRLVRVSDKSHGPSPFTETCDNLFRDAGLKHRDDFHTRYPIVCERENTQQELRFNYVIGNGKAIAAFQRVTPSDLQNFASSAFCFECVRDARILPKNKVGALIDLSANENAPASRIELLGHLATIIPIQDHDQAIETLHEMAG
ncbi:MAG: hypothetical protein IID44_12445 [Planctomycetes bacterium]|nr:hypothetical protein [Planctomycetota bacterium]